MTNQGDSQDQPGAHIKIVGVDFSGAQYDNATAVTEGVLQDKVLRITSCILLSGTRESAHYRLEQLLNDLPGDAVVAMDFPFSVPRAFAEEFVPNVLTMSDVWKKAAELKTLEAFNALSYIDEHNKDMRLGDKLLSNPDPLPALQKGDRRTKEIAMRNMTFYGMQMLHRLWSSKEKGFHTPPLNKDGRTGPVLLETYPGAVLSNLDLQYEGYKQKPYDPNGKCRHEILLGLVDKLGMFDIQIELPEPWKGQCQGYHDCLDSLVAAIVAVLWKEDKPKLRTPDDGNLNNARLEEYAKLEGWIYAPKKG